MTQPRTAAATAARTRNRLERNAEELRAHGYVVEAPREHGPQVIRGEVLAARTAGGPRDRHPGDR